MKPFVKIGRRRCCFCRWCNGCSWIDATAIDSSLSGKILALLTTFPLALSGKILALLTTFPLALSGKVLALLTTFPLALSGKVLALVTTFPLALSGKVLVLLVTGGGHYRVGFTNQTIVVFSHCSSHLYSSRSMCRYSVWRLCPESTSVFFPCYALACDEACGVLIGWSPWVTGSPEVSIYWRLDCVIHETVIIIMNTWSA